MCGFVGIIDWNTLPSQSLLAKMSSAIRHRGPDAHAMYMDGPVGLAHQRLSVIDLDPRSNQPFVDTDNRYVLVYNGEVYNFQQLRETLVSLGHIFYTTSDTEVVLNAYKQWGEACVTYFNGMFAFAIWDTQQQSLFLARDRTGEKPLYYQLLDNNGIIFGSELSVFRIAGASEISREGLKHYMRFGYSMPHQSLLSQVHKLPPAHTLSLTQDRPMRIARYWNLKETLRNKASFDLTFEEAAYKLQNLIDASVAMRCISDVPMGAFLSGGIDSATITASMQQACNHKVKAFSIGFENDAFDESALAKETAAYLGVDHHVEIMPHLTDKRLVDIGQSLDEPLADTSFFPSYVLAEYARKYVTVALGGDGADELFAGYSTYYATQLLRYMPLRSFIWKAAYKLVSLYPHSRAKVSLDFKLRQLCAGAGYGLPHAHAMWRQLAQHHQYTQMIHPDYQCDEEDYQPHAVALELRDADMLDKAMVIDINGWLADDILVKTDRASMASSLELRSPFLDHHIIEYAASLPSHYRWQLGNAKRILKESQKHRLPETLLKRKKQGFNAPCADWFTDQSPNIKEILMTPVAADPFMQPYINQLWHEHQNHRRDNHLLLLCVFSYRLWASQTYG